MKYVIILSLMFSASVVSAQQLLYPSIFIYGTRKTINDFIPPGWDILDSAKGDLDKDGLEDAAVILQYRDTLKFVSYVTGKVVVAQPRFLFILLKSNDTSYRYVDQSNTFILLNDNPDRQDPYKSISIQKGVLQISFRLVARSGNEDEINSTHKFRWQNGSLRLIGADLNISKRSTNEYIQYSYNFSTLKRELTKNVANEKPITTVKDIFPYFTRTLTDTPAPFTWEIESGVFL